MAAADYIHCAGNCTNGHKLIYTGDRYWEEKPPVVYCQKCYQKLEKKLEKKLTKTLKRKK